MKIKTNIKPIILLLIAFIMLTACKQQKTEWQGIIEVVDGATVVRNPIEPMYEEDVLSLEEELTIGEKKGREEYMFSLIMMDVDDEENIYVLDRETANIRVFNKEGKYVQTIGRRGQGPGEMQSPRLIQITPQNEIMVYDMRNRRLAFYASDGIFLRHIPAANVIAFLFLKIDSNRNFVGYVLDREGNELIKYDSELKPIYTLFKSPPITPRVMYLVTPFMEFSLTKDDNIVWGYAEKYELHVVDSDGKVLKKILKDYVPIKITSEDKERITNERYGSRGVPVGYTLECPENYPPFKSLFIDDEGRIYLETYEKCEDGGCFSDVFDTDGKYIAKVRLGINPVWLVWKKGKLYTIEKDEEGYMFVKRYSAKWHIPK
jgi:hypothetical protein